MESYRIIGGDPDEAEAAAALAAVACLLDEELAAAQAVARSAAAPTGWHDAARLLVQGLTPTRLPVALRWSSVERLRRAGRSNGGIVGQ